MYCNTYVLQKYIHIAQYIKIAVIYDDIVLVKSRHQSHGFMPTKERNVRSSLSPDGEHKDRIECYLSK